MHQKLLSLLIGFEWDAGNAQKNERKHLVTSKEAEQVFINNDLVIAPDITHSEHEERYYAYGKTAEKRTLIIAFTVRRHSVRVIMARDMSRKERKWYEEEIEKDSEI